MRLFGNPLQICYGMSEDIGNSLTNLLEGFRRCNPLINSFKVLATCANVIYIFRGLPIPSNNLPEHNNPSGAFLEGLG